MIVGVVEIVVQPASSSLLLAPTTGSVRTQDGEHTFTGSGLRIRRQGVRRLAEFRGHCWQSALFPSGRGFGYIAYPPRDDGQPTFNEGYIFEGEGKLLPARVVGAPWLTRLQALGQDVSLVLEPEARKLAAYRRIAVISAWLGLPSRSASRQ